MRLRSEKKSKNNSHDSPYTLSIEECREYLGDTNLTDKEIRELRDSLCSFIDKVLDNYFNKLLK